MKKNKIQTTIEAKHESNISGIIPIDNWKLLGILCITLFLIYGKTLSYDFTGDDVLVTKNNSFVQKGIGGIKHIFKHSYLYGYTLEKDPLYRPIPNAQFAIERSWFGMNPLSFHFFQLFDYFIALILLFFVLLRWTKSNLFAFSACLIHLIHPIHTEVIANIKSRDEITAFIGLLLMLYFYTKENKSVRHTILALMGFFIALFSKESSLAFIALLPVYDLFIQKNKIKNSLLNLIPFIVLSVFYLLIRKLFVNPDFNLRIMDNSLMVLPDFWSRFPSIIAMYGKYIFMTIFPFHLSYDYSFNAIPLASWSDWRFWSSLLTIGMMIMAIFYFRNINKWISFGIAWFFITSLITSNLFFLLGSTFAERFMFVPSLALAIIIGALIDQYKEYLLQHRLILYSLVSILILPMSWYSFHRSSVWKNDAELFKSGIISAPQSARTNSFYGKYFYDLAKVEKDSISREKLLDSAIQYYNKALIIAPHFHTCSHFMAWAFREKGDTENEKNALLRSYLADSTYFPALISLSVWALKQKDYVAAKEFCQKAQKMRVNNYDIEYNLGLAYRGLKSYEDAIVSFEKCLKINPEREDPLSQLVKIYRDDLNNIPRALYYNNLIKNFRKK